MFICFQILPYMTWLLNKIFLVAMIQTSVLGTTRKFKKEIEKTIKESNRITLTNIIYNTQCFEEIKVKTLGNVNADFLEN